VYLNVKSQLPAGINPKLLPSHAFLLGMLEGLPTRIDLPSLGAGEGEELELCKQLPHILDLSTRVRGEDSCT
jgi:hypothetical protein